MKKIIGGLAIAVMAVMAWFFFQQQRQPPIDPTAEDAQASATVREIADYAVQPGQPSPPLRILFSRDCKDGCNIEKSLATLGRVKRIVEQRRVSTDTVEIMGFISRHRVTYRMLVELEKGTAQIQLTMSGVGKAAVVETLAVRTPPGSSPGVEFYTGAPGDMPKGKDW